MIQYSSETTVSPQPIAGPVVPAGIASGTMVLIDQLLRDRRGLRARIEAGEGLDQVARAMICTIIVAAMVFGAALGLFRGGVQIVFAALKMPLVILLTAALTTPALSALRVVVDGHAQFRRDLALVLSSLALGSLVLAALAPIVMLAVSWHADYHALILVTVGCCAIGGAVGLSFFIAGTRDLAAGSRVLIVSLVLVVVALVGAQMSWTLRPYLVRPRTEEVVFVRSLEGSFIDAVNTSTWSAMGVYAREKAPLPAASGTGREVGP